MKRAAKKDSVQAHLLIASATIGAALVEIAALTSTTLALKVVYSRDRYGYNEYCARS